MRPDRRRRAPAPEAPAHRASHTLIHLGTAGWSLPRALQDRFPGDHPHLARYAAQFGAVEINSSFHRPHRPSTYARWAASVPASFRFAVKMPKTITHVARLVGAVALLDAFCAESAGLGERLGCILVQLPPSLALVRGDAEGFMQALRARYGGDVAVEPRHASWFEADGTALLRAFHCARVASHPARVPEAASPGGWDGFAYWRLHGAPRIYYSSYVDADLVTLADTVRAAAGSGRATWCIFDNTALGAAAANALTLRERLGLSFAAFPTAIR